MILGLWAAVLGAALPALVETVRLSFHAAGTAVAALAVASSIFIAYFWLNGMKDVVYTAWFHLRMKRAPSPVPALGRAQEPRVVMVYCTFNDFCADSLARSVRQSYGNFAVAILDDSTQAAFRDEIDEFALNHGFSVVRRTSREGFKAGNLNNFLMDADYDYFVILDSDEVTPANFITRCLDYFDHYDNVGIVQANHVATRSRNDFTEMFGIGVDSHWVAYQTVKDRYGFLSLLGHGAMVSRECYMAAGGFPMVVAEDLCMSIAARDAGFVTAFAPDVVCEEEYPVDYLAFKKRHSKWTQGNMEFIKKFTGTIFTSRMSWFEKLDIVLFTYSLPLTALFAVYVVLHVVMFPLLDVSIDYPLWMAVPTVIFLLAPMLNDFVFYLGRMPAKKLRRYFLHTVLLYGSMFFVSVKVGIASGFGSSTFLVTPKVSTKVTFREAVRANRSELIFGLGAGLVAIALTGSLLPVLLLVMPALASVYLTIIHQAPPRDR